LTGYAGLHTVDEQAPDIAAARLGAPARDRTRDVRKVVAPMTVSTAAATSAPSDGRFVRMLHRHRGLAELLLIGALYLLYDGSRLVVAGRRSSALAHAMNVLNVEKGLDVAWEQTINTFVSAHAFLAVSSDYVYATLHYLVTPAVLVWLWRRHRDVYPRARTTLVVATILGLIGFIMLPVAPPRMLPGFVDTMAQYSTAGWWGSSASAPRGVGYLTNQFAAMPSLHVGWALWCGWQLVQHAQRRSMRIIGVVYPALITLVVVATGNHYVLDALAGVAVVLLAMAAVGGVARVLPRRSVATVEPARVVTLDSWPTAQSCSPSSSSRREPA
jgi:hypothetical protein